MERRHGGAKRNHRHNDHEPRSRSRSRSRSPYQHDRARPHKKRRTQSPAHKPAVTLPSLPKILPFRARRLHKHDFDAYEPLFALYLDVQKEILLEDLSEREVRGRWKRFLRKWNGRELAEGWYDPATKGKADDAAAAAAAGDTSMLDVRGAEGGERSPQHDFLAREDEAEEEGGGGGGGGEAEPTTRNSITKRKHIGHDDGTSDDDSDDNDDDFGPAIPRATHRSGPAIATTSDLILAAEQRAEDAELARQDRVYARRTERREQKDRMEELVGPRADAGTRERQLEKKREVASGNAAFRDAKDGGDAEVREADLMGDEGMEGYRRQQAEMRRRKTAKEVRREEAARARIAEREERMKKVQEKEDKTMEYLKALVKERFG